VSAIQDSCATRAVGIAVALPNSAAKLNRFGHQKGRWTMNWENVQGNWKQFKGKVKEKWGKLTDDELTVVAGKRDQLSGILQKKYGYAKEQAEKELDEFTRSLDKA
jgi:uncharacterized protein YjbJ (UPF0337 family)